MEKPEIEADDTLAEQRPDRPTLLYDDGCRFCRAMAEALYHLARRRELAFLPWSNGSAAAWLGELEPAVRDRSMHLKLPDGTLVSGFGVLGRTLACVRGLKWIGWLTQHVDLAARLVAWSYAFVAGHREIFSRIVPDRPPVMRKPGLR